MLQRAGIGAYFAGTVDILQKPLLQAILSAMQAASRFSYEDVMQYLKSGFSPLTADACDRLERYAYFWNIRGSQWLSDWTRHPDGFGHEFTDETQQTLLELNTWRAGGLEPLEALHKAWLSGRTVSERLRALSSFLEQTHFPETACEQTNELYRQGAAQAAQEQEQLYEILLTAMEQAELVLGGQEMELELFLQMFRMLLGCYQVGSIPANLDEVLVGSLDAMRALQAGVSSRARCGRGRVSGVFSGGGPSFRQREKEPFEPRCDAFSVRGGTAGAGTRLDAAGASERETSACGFISGSEQPSYLMARTKAILPQCETLSQERRAALCRTGARCAAEAIREGETWPLDPLTLQIKYEMEKRCGFSVSAISRETVQGLYGEKVGLSASKLDQFAGCRYAFFLRYGLKLEPWRQASFDAPVFGTFAHHVLECTVRDVMAQGGFHAVPRETVLRIAARHMDEYAKNFMSAAQQTDERCDVSLPAKPRRRCWTSSEM